MIWIYKKDLENWQKLQNDLKSIRMTPNKKTENKLLTAVEWYTDELLGLMLELATNTITEREYHAKRRKAFEQAKQMEKAKYIILSEIKGIELPSDEEIEQRVTTLFGDVGMYQLYDKDRFIDGAKWMKEQILNKTK